MVSNEISCAFFYGRFPKKQVIRALIPHLIDRPMLNINFKDRIPIDKHVVAVLVPHRYSPLWKNCPNYDIPYESPFLTELTDKGAVLAGRNELPFMMNPLGDAIIVLDE